MTRPGRVDFLLFMCTIITIELHIYGCIGDLLMILMMCAVLSVLVIEHRRDMFNRNRGRQ
jgi:hypothetical protein